MIPWPDAARAWRRLISGMVAAALVSLSIAAAQNRDTVWTRVAAEGSTIILSWHKDHPWDAQLGARGAELVAEYRTQARGLVREPLARATAEGERTYRFALPDTVRSQPLGAICLYVQPLGRQGLLPVRRASNDDRDTARFRYEPWEREVRNRTDARMAQSRLEPAERQIQVIEQEIAAGERGLRDRGWTTAQACEAITVAPTELVQPYNVVPIGEQDDIARRVCVARVWAGREINDRYIAGRLAQDIAKLDPARDVERARSLVRSIYTEAFIQPEAAGAILEAVKDDAGAGRDATLAMREAQAREFQRDWERHAPAIRDYEPHLGERNDVLPWPSSARDAAFRVLGPSVAKQLGAEWAMEGLAPASSRDRLGVVGAALDAYSGCVDDARKQLRIVSDNWEALRAAEPARDRLRREFLVRECRQEIAALESLKAERDRLQDRLADDRALVAAATASALPARQQVLNAMSCAQQ